MKKHYEFKKLMHFTMSVLFLFLCCGFYANAETTCSSGDPTTENIVPEEVSGNPKLCTTGVRLQPQTQVYNFENGSITITVESTECGQVFSWVASGIKMYQIVVKGGNKANIYDYSETDILEDGYLHSPVNESGKYAGLSHIDICFDDSPPTAPSCDITGKSLSCYNEKDGEITVTWGGGTGPFTVDLFKDDDEDPLVTRVGATSPEDFTGLEAGKYWVQITDANGQFSTCEIEITQPDEVLLSISSTNVTCYGEADGTISVDSYSGTGTPSFYISDDGGANWEETTVAAIEADTYGPGTYIVKVTYPAGAGDGVCEATDEVTISQPDEVMLSISSTNVTCNGDADGTISVDSYSGTGTASFYISSNGGASWAETTVNDIESGAYGPGTYTVKVTYPNGIGDGVCEATDEVTITQPDDVMLSISSTDVKCNGDADGTINVDSYSGTGTASFYISSDGGASWAETTVNDIESGAYGPGTYTIKVAYPDGNGVGVCEATDEVTITQPDELTCTATEDSQASCDLSVGGSATVYPVGGTPFDVGDPYLFSWKNSSNVEVGTSASVSGLAPGVYVVTVTDANNCTTTCEVEITRAPEEFINCETLFALGDNETCFINNGFDRWGWTNLITESEEPYIMPLWAGAGQCDTGKGTEVGYAEVTYFDGTVSVEYFMTGNYVLTEAHVYVGTTPYPMTKGKKSEPTVAPGQYNYNSGPLDNVDGLTDIVFEGLSGTVYIIIHGVSCEAVCMWEEPEALAVNFYQNLSATIKSASIDVLDVNGNSLKAYPNPFSSEVTFEFAAGKDARALLEITNIAGQRIATLMDRHVHQGVVNSVRFSPANVAEGVLIYRLILGDEVQTGRLIYRK